MLEIRAFFGSGTQLQEMYVTPALMTQQNWDDLAEAAKWSRQRGHARGHALGGGSSADRQVYGWASWSPKKGILTLRNPTARTQQIKVDPAKVFELPEGAAQNYTIVKPRRTPLNQTSLRGNSGAGSPIAWPGGSPPHVTASSLFGSPLKPSCA